MRSPAETQRSVQGDPCQNDPVRPAADHHEGPDRLGNGTDPSGARGITPTGIVGIVRLTGREPTFAAVAFVADRYDDEDWSRLGWVMVRGNAKMLGTGPEHAAAQQLLRNRYPQMEAMALERHPVIAIRIDRVTSWGDLRS